MAGYDEWWTSFPRSFDKVVQAARAKGARRIIWLTYREGVRYKLLTGERADEAFIKNNQTLRDKVASRAFPLLLICDEKDEALPCRHSEMINAAARGPKQLWVVPGAFHTAAYGFFPEEFRRRVLAFFAENSRVP